MKNTMRHIPVLVLAWLAVGFISGCVQPLAHVTSPGEVSSSDVILVGKIELIPPLTDAEQDHSVTVKALYKDTIWYYLHSKPTAIPDAPLTLERENFLTAKFGKTFYVKAPRKRSYFTMGLIYLKYTGTVIHRIYMPGGFYVDVHPGDQAVYMGTIRYTRNDFFDLKNMEVIDDYAKAKKALEKKFGTSVKLVKRLPKPYKIPEASK